MIVFAPSLIIGLFAFLSQFQGYFDATAGVPSAWSARYPGEGALSVDPFSRRQPCSKSTESYVSLPPYCLCVQISTDKAPKDHAGESRLGGLTADDHD